MRKFSTLAIIATISLIGKSIDAYASFSPSVMRITAGTGISISGTGNIASPLVITNTNPANTPTYNNAPSITLNTSSQISTLRPARVSYSVGITTAVSLLNLNSAGSAFLEISQNNSTWVTISQAGISRTLSVAITLGINETNTYNLQGEVPTGWYRRIRTTTSGGGSVGFSNGQEVLY